MVGLCLGDLVEWCAFWEPPAELSVEVFVHRGVARVNGVRRSTRADSIARSTCTIGPFLIHGPMSRFVCVLAGLIQPNLRVSLQQFRRYNVR